jgi:cytochrome c553
MKRLVFLISILGSPTFTFADGLDGRTMANTCAGCHGTNGVPAVSYIPPLAGLSEEEFTKAMVAYRNGTRTATIMNRVAPAFTDAEIAAMAAYFAGLPPAGADTQIIRIRPNTTEGVTE